MRISKIHILLLFLSLFLYSSCSKEEDKLMPENEMIQILSTISRGSGLRLSGSNFEENDRIGVFTIPYTTGNAAPGTFPQDAHANNAELKYNAEKWIPTRMKLTWPGQRKCDIYGYYPYSEELSVISSNQYNFSVKTDQRNPMAYAESDFLWAKAEGLSPTKNIMLMFNHRMAQVSIHVLSAIDFQSQPFNEIEVSLVDVNPSAILSMSNGEVTLNESEGKTEVKAMEHEQPTSGFNASYSSIIPPQTILKDTRFIKVVLDGVTYYYQPKEDIVLESGTSITFKIVINRQGLEVSYALILEWVGNGSIDGSIGEKAPRIADLNAINWNASLVHNIYDKGALVAQACKEYLFKNGGNIDAQAIVVYPFNNGKTDLSNGFVAQVMNRKINTSNGQYEPNSSSIHGGNVQFNASTNALNKYTPGTSPKVNKIAISSNGIEKANDNAIPTLTTQPAQLTDVDENNYSIVKIGTQYWISENFRSEHYNNGDPLTYYYYHGNVGYKNSFGALYKWTTIIDSRSIAPSGWKVPSYQDWTSLQSYLTPDPGKKLKANTLWINLNFNDNVTGFSGLPSGRITDSGVHNELYYYGQWWSRNVYDSTTAYRMYLDYGNTSMLLAALGMNYTQSLRLIKDTPL